MSTSLDKIIEEISISALDGGLFTSVQQFKLNLDSNSDTLLPKLFIKLNEVKYDKLLVNAAEEEYILELIIVLADSDNPISDLKTKMDNLLKKLFTENKLISRLATQGKITLDKANLTNKRDVYAALGGESVSILMEISNINTFGGTPCE